MECIAPDQDWCFLNAFRHHGGELQVRGVLPICPEISSTFGSILKFFVMTRQCPMCFPPPPHWCHMFVFAAFVDGDVCPCHVELSLVTSKWV